MMSHRQINRNMSLIRSKNSAMERSMGKVLWDSGLRYRKHYSKLIGKPDFVLVKDKVAIFCDSSFWHGYRFGQTSRHRFKTNRSFWRKKIQCNMSRDRLVTGELSSLGWKVFRFWDHQIKKNPRHCIERVFRYLRK